MNITEHARNSSLWCVVTIPRSALPGGDLRLNIRWRWTSYDFLPPEEAVLSMPRGVLLSFLVFSVLLKWCNYTTDISGIWYY